MIVMMVALMVARPSRVLAQENAADALLKLKTSLVNADPALGSWNPSTPPCTGNTGNWAGVLCYNGYVRGLQLDNMGLQVVADTSDKN